MTKKEIQFSGTAEDAEGAEENREEDKLKKIFSASFALSAVSRFLVFGFGLICVCAASDLISVQFQGFKALEEADEH